MAVSLWSTINRDRTVSEVNRQLRKIRGITLRGITLDEDNPKRKTRPILLATLIVRKSVRLENSHRSNRIARRIRKELFNISRTNICLMQTHSHRYANMTSGTLCVADCTGQFTWLYCRGCANESSCCSFQTGRHGRGEAAAPEWILKPELLPLIRGWFTLISRGAIIYLSLACKYYFSFHLSLRTQPFVLQEHCEIPAMSLAPQRPGTYPTR